MTQELNEMIEELKRVLVNIDSEHELNELKSKYLGKKSLIIELYSKMKDLSVEDKKELGLVLNDVKSEVMDLIESKHIKMASERLAKSLAKEQVDVTLPGLKVSVGVTNPMQRVIEDVEDLFVSMGYDVVEGPEVESDLYNFEMLNLDKDHPARDTQDSFYINEEYLLRTQTSPVQVRTMLANEEKKPLRVICPGKTYRRDNDDATHSHQFGQIEGLLVDKNVSLANLKATLEVVVRHLFGEDREIRFRPNYFPFTEPSYEVDVTCFKCDHDLKCPICKGTGWIEILGSGMVHPNVLRNAGYDPEVYTGFAFGMGIERIAMLKYGIKDIRELYTNDMRFLKQYGRSEVDTNEGK